MDVESILRELETEKSDLQFQLKDLEYFIQLKEQELAELRSASEHISELRSRIDQQLYSFEQMQLRIQEEERQKNSALRREASLEEEMIQSVEMEKAYYALKDQFRQHEILVNQLNEQVNESTYLYQLVADLKRKIAALESELEIVKLDNHFLKEDSEP